MKMFPFEITYQGKEILPIATKESRQCYFYEIGLKEVKKRSINHHILLIDVSDAMAPYIEQLKTQLIETLDWLLSTGKHYVTVITYAGHGESRHIIQGVRCKKKDYEMAQVYKCIEEELYPRGYGVISESLELALQIVDALEDSCEGQHIFLFTSGLLAPSKWTIQEEEQRCISMAKACSKHNVTLNLIGFGMYYDSLLLKRMSQYSTYGELVHMKQLDYSHTIKKLIKQADEKWLETLFIRNESYFFCGNHNFYQTPEVMIGLDKGKSELLVVFDKPIVLSNKKIRHPNKKVRDEQVSRFLYHLGIYYLENNELDQAQAVMATTGDLAAYEKICSSYLESEKRQCIEFLNQLTQQPKWRYKKGKQLIKIHQPEEQEEICLLEVLQLILDTPGATLLWDYATPYQRIGLSYELVEENYHLIMPTSGYGEVEELLIGSKKLNIGLLVKVNAMVEEAETHLKLDTYVYREYNLLLNGQLNIDTLACRLPKALKLRLSKMKIIKKVYQLVMGEVCILDLKKLKITNKRMIHLLVPELLAEYLYDLEVLKVKQKVIKKMIEELGVVNPIDKEAVSLTKKMLYERFHLDEQGMYCPTKKTLNHIKAVGFYKAEILEWKIEKFPKARYEEEVRAMYEQGLPTSWPERFMQLQEELNCIKQEKKEKNKKVQLMRLAVGFMKQDAFLWDKRITKNKKVFCAQLQDNSVIGGTSHIATKQLGEISIREDRYLLMIPFHQQ